MTAVPIDSPTTASTDPDGSLLIRATHLAKAYQLYDKPADRLKQQLFGRFGKTYGKPFHALHDVSFDLKRGETLGIIGRNGSGKSTLLQILAGVLQPTGGELAVHGRIAALLELGSGFNSEYTGRENVFMNGAILGIDRAEMTKRYGEIVAFADIGEFVDHPVKTYSSGMFVRLAFAVATHVNADVLLVDEALAVGDVFFRQKCYQRLNVLRERGVAIILVSHAMVEVEQFCKRAILLDHGHVQFAGQSAEAVKRYYLIEQEQRLAARGDVILPSALPGEGRRSHSGDHGGEEIATTPAGPYPDPLPRRDGSGPKQDLPWPDASAFLDLSKLPQIEGGWARCTGVALCDSTGHACSLFEQGETASVFTEYELFRDIEVPVAGLVLFDDKGTIVFGKNSIQYDGFASPRFIPAGSRLRMRQEVSLQLRISEYTLEVGLSTISQATLDRYDSISHAHFAADEIRLCHLPNVTVFQIVFRRDGGPKQLTHHGVANLPGRVSMAVVGEKGDRPAEPCRVARP